LTTNWNASFIGATFASWHNMLFLLQVITARKNVAPFAVICDIVLFPC